MRMGTYARLAKSGIVLLVGITALAGYLIGHPFESSLSISHLTWTLIGTMLLAGGASVLNQIQEAKIDSKMPRTQLRPLPAGEVTYLQAALFCIALLFLGALCLWIARLEALILGLVTLFLYNGLYTLWWKRHWAFAAVPGAIPGALPVLMGYTAATGKIVDPEGLYLFFLLFFWQMPHFWVLALKYESDYRAGGVPTLPVALGKSVTLFQIRLWLLAYLALSLLGLIFLPVGIFYGCVALITGGKLYWEFRPFFKDPSSKNWIRAFLWVNFSLILYLGAATLDAWKYYFFLFLPF